MRIASILLVFQKSRERRSPLAKRGVKISPKLSEMEVSDLRSGLGPAALVSGTWTWASRPRRGSTKVKLLVILVAKR